MKILLQLNTILIILFSIHTTGHGATEYMGLGTGEVTGIYYQAGGAIAQILNPQKDTNGIRIIVEPTVGSVFNINAIEKDIFPLALVQSDSQFFALHGMASWKEIGKQSKFRSICSLYPESITILIRKHSGIRTLTDLKNKNVNLGSPESGTFQNAIDVLRSIGIDPKKDLNASSMTNDIAADMMMSGRLDALFVTVGHPSVFVKQLLSSLTKITLLPITGMERLLDTTPYYTKTVIPSQFYPTLKKGGDIESIGVRATLVASADVSEEIIYTLTKEIFENFEQFKALHPVFSTLTTETMLEGCVAPFHKGAMRYYKQALMKK